jgi:hypothetical protein
MNDIQHTARKVVAAGLVANQVKDIEKELKAELLEACQATGTRTLDVTDTDGTPLATVSKASGKAKAAVVDESEFEAWVAKNYPDSVTTVTVIDPDIRLRLLNAATAAGDAVDVETGEVIPGVEIKPGSVYITARPTAEAKAKMRTILAGSPVLELAGGDTDAE